MEQLVKEMQIFLGLELSKDHTSESAETSSEADKIGHINDVCYENNVLNQCGLGLSEEEAYLVYISLKTFNKSKGFTYTKFWGKILGVDKDYYILETEVEDKDTEEEVNLEVS